MELPGIIKVGAEQTNLIEELSLMMGKSFLEEGWTQLWLSALDEVGAPYERKLEISCAIMKYNFSFGAPHNCLYMLEDGSAATGGYLSSELDGLHWGQIEDRSMEAMMCDGLSEEERTLLMARMEKMSFISNFDWIHEESHGADFLHFYAIGVDSERRSSGAFRRLMTPFFDYADRESLTCYLECYSEKTESIYSHFGFQVEKTFRDPEFATYERCMARPPHKA